MDRRREFRRCSGPFHRFCDTKADVRTPSSGSVRSSVPCASGMDVPETCRIEGSLAAGSAGDERGARVLVFAP
jgi:hypothetical protein